jgi:hypothetical protein
MRKKRPAKESPMRESKFFGQASFNLSDLVRD